MLKKNPLHRGVTPILAVILLIGITVAAASMIYLVVLPMMEPKTEGSIQNAIFYEEENEWIIEFDIVNTGVSTFQVTELRLEDNRGHNERFTLITDEYLNEDITTTNRLTFILNLGRIASDEVTIIVSLSSHQSVYETVIKE